MSHQLPRPVLGQLRQLARNMEACLQSESHRVSKAMGQSDAFDEGYIDSCLTRALLSYTAQHSQIRGLQVEKLSNGGIEVACTFDRVERRFRVRRATVDKYGVLDVRTNSDSLLTRAASREPQLWDTPSMFPMSFEQWVLPYLIDMRTRTIEEIWAGRVVGKVNDASPYRLVLADLVQIAPSSPTRREFTKREEDLELPEEGEQGGDAGRA